MADNVAITAGTGTTVHADEYTHATLGAGKTQLVKLVDGTLDSGTAIAAGGGVEAGALRVTVASDSTGVLSVDDNGGTLTVDGTVAVTNAGITTIAGAISGTEMQVDVVTLPAVDLGANNDVTVTNATAANLKAEVVGTGTFAVQAAAAIADGSDVTLGAKADAKSTATDTTAISVMSVLKQISASVQAPPSQAVTGTFYQATQPVSFTGSGDVATQTTLAAMNAKMVTGTDIGDVTINNSTGAAAVNIQDGGNTITVDNGGTFAVQAASTLAAETTKVIGTVNIASSQTVGLAAGTAGIGKLTANSGVDIGDVDILSIAAGNNNIGDVDVASIAAGTNTIGKLLPPDVDVTAHTNYARKYYTSAGAATDGIVWSPAAGKRWHVVTLYLQVSAAATVTLEDDKAAGDDPVWKGELAANSGVVLSFTEKYPMASGEDAADLLITTTAGNVYVTAVGYEI